MNVTEIATAGVLLEHWDELTEALIEGENDGYEVSAELGHLLRFARDRFEEVLV